MARVEHLPIQVDNNRFKVGSETVPWFSGNEASVVAIAPFPDHGRPIFLGSLLRANPLFLNIAKNLNPDDSQKINARMRVEIEKYLDQGEASKSAAVFSSTRSDQPDIQVSTIGNPYDGIRLYYHRGEFKGAPAFYLDAVAKDNDVKRVEKFLIESGYKPPKNWSSGSDKTRGRNST